MNFFAEQEAARRRTWRLVIVYIIAVLLIIAALDVIIATAMILIQGTAAQAMNPLRWMESHQNTVLVISLAILAFIGLASLYRIVSLSGGGGVVARQLGGTRVNEETRDRAIRRYINIVEEMAIAAGLPVPEIYVLENESGINAFAAGYDTGDAAIAVTRGALDVFDRDELQGVIGHEFSHILHGDMRLNTRLLGPLFGIMLISLLGRIILRSMSRVRVRSSSNSRNSGGGVLVILLLGVGLTVVGYIGHLAGSIIKAAISRQREFLADASSVQFTRNPDGIGGALKKIAAWQYGSTLASNGVEEVSHMLFAEGLRSQVAGLFATHPPLAERLQRLGRRLSNDELTRLALQLREINVGGSVAGGGEQLAGFSSGETGDVSVEKGTAAMSGVAHGLPNDLYAAAHDTTEVVGLVFGMILDPSRQLRERQVLMIDHEYGHSIAQRTAWFWQEIDSHGQELRLPLLELSFPAIRRMTWQQQDKFHDLVEQVITLDARINCFEYLLSRLLLQIMQESSQPRRRIRSSPGRKLYHYKYELGLVFSVLAGFGHDDLGAAQKAYTTGLYRLASNQDWPDMHVPQDWASAMDTALSRLDRLRPLLKEELVSALQATADFDGRRNITEQELLRVIAGLIHVPLPASQLPGDV